MIGTSNFGEKTPGVLRMLRRMALALSLTFSVPNALAATPGSCDADMGVDPLSYGLSASYCELCGTGTIQLVVTNPYGVDMTGVVIRQDLLASGLTYVPGSAVFTPAQTISPVVSGPGDSVVTWDLGSYLLSGPSHPMAGHEQLTLTFQVRSFGAQEPLASAVRNIQASLDYRLSNSHGSDCDLSPRAASAGPVELPIHQPVPQTIKMGRNADAGQNNYAAAVFGNTNDDVIWRIQVNNTGDVALQDLILDDTMQSGNYVINYRCATAGAADAVANGHQLPPLGAAMGCEYLGGITTVNGFIVDDPYGAAGSPVDIAAGGTAEIYLVGKVTSSCNNRSNTVQNVAWGCVADGPVAGGITQPAASGSVTPTYSTTSTATLGTLVNTGSGLTVTTTFTGTDGGNRVGSKGVVTITIANDSGGTVKNIHLIDTLPPDYVVDPTFTPTIAVTRAYVNSYAGVVDRVVWTNPAGPTVPATTGPLSNKVPEFDLLSTGSHPAYPDQVNLLRNGDTAVVTFRMVLVNPAHYDDKADLDVAEETAPATDPANVYTTTNQLVVQYNEFCTPGTRHEQTVNGNVPVDVEDLDVDINGTIFILTNTDELPLQVRLANHGGHSAADWHLFVTFGATMDVVGVPAGCTVTTNPPPLAVWRSPAPIPAAASVYQCTGTAIAPNTTRNFDFRVRKTTDEARLALDDLTFRADVVGQITLSDGALLWFPTPDPGTINNTSNNYSLDGFRARVIGFNLLKNEVGNCSEENSPPPTTPDSRVIIGEECTFHVETGGWFGFMTPGFNYIAVRNVVVADDLPAGQAFLREIVPAPTSTTNIRSVVLTAPTPPAEGDFTWRFNPTGQEITQRDEWFRMNVMTRITNNPDDPAYNSTIAPNYHGANSRNTLVSNFDAIFRDTNGVDVSYPLGPGTVGYPLASVRQVDLTITEPRIVVTKTVCDETLHGAGTACSSFAATNNEGDAHHSYIYRIVVTNRSADNGYTHAPAYDVISRDTLDASDLLYVVPFESDGLDNDGDGLIDGADTDGEGSISDNLVNNGTPPVITFSYSNSTPLLRLAPGASVRFYYRVDPDERVAPLQSLVNSVATSYDSLPGVSGNQSAPQMVSGDPAGARRYDAPVASATVQIIPVVTQPKIIYRLSNTAAGPAPQSVAIGEEVEYELDTQLPVALLRAFIIRDELPAGMRCVEAPAVNLDAAPYNAAGFVPGGTITPTCAGNVVEWNFGDQRITHGTGIGRYSFAVRFIARVDNSAGNNDGVILSNGSPATNAIATYINDAGTLVPYSYGHVDLRVREPHIALTKAFAVTHSDAGDEVTVTITATNNGTGSAYNLQVFDDIAAVGNLIFLSGVGGLDPPDVVDTTAFGANRPLFRWTAANPRFAIAPGAVVSFTFKVRVLGGAQPLELFNNTAQATWTSLPGRSPALNATNQIGPDGSTTGLRNGAIPPAGDAINDYESSGAASMSVPPITLAKTEVAPIVIPAPGAHKHFQIEIRLPEGTSNNVVATDNLAQGSVSYLLANNAGYDVTYTFQGITTINGVAPSEAAFTAFPADNTSGTAVWNIGTVVTASEDDLTTHAITPLIRIDYYARVNNDLVTDIGDTVQNGVTLNYRNGQSGATESVTAATAVATVVEPQLTITRTWANVTAGKAASDAPDGGDLIEYTLTLQNGGTSTAYDINLAESLSADLRFESGFTPTATINGTAVSGFVATPAGVAAGPLVWGRGHGDNSLDLPSGQNLVITWRARVQSTVEPGTVLTNSVLADWTSLDGASSWERTGAGCPTITAPNDYCTGPVTGSVTVGDTNAITKSITNDTWVDALSTAGDAIVRVGDTITYRLAVRIQEGRTRQVRVQDTIPAGMSFVDVVSINGVTVANYLPPASGPGSNFAYVPLTAANRPAAGQTGTLVWNFGTVVNDAMGDATTDDLVIVYRVRVTPDAGIAQVAQTTLTNSATLSYLDAADNSSPPAARLASQAGATLRQPIINTFTKVDRSGRISGNAVNVSTDVMRFRLSACNTTGLAPAYSVLLSDTLPTQMNEASLTGPVRGAGAPDVYVNGTLATAGADYLYTAAAGRGGTWTLRLNQAINPGQCAVVDYDMGFHSDVGGNQSWQNSATVNEYWSLANSSGQRYGPVGPALFNMNNIASPLPPPAKSLYAPASGEATIGTEVIYRIAVPNVAAASAMYDVVVNDVLDPSLRYLSARDVSGNGFVLIDNSVLPGQVSLRIATIPAGRQAIIELHARVDNNSVANAGTAFANTASYAYANLAGGVPINGGSSTTAGQLRIVEPSLTAAKTVDNLTRPGQPPDAGDVLRYTITLTAAGGAVGDNFSNAFDVAVTESLAAGLAWRGSPAVTGTGNTLGTPAITGDGVTTAQTLRWSLAQGNANVDVAEGQAVTITYEMNVLDPVRASQTLSNASALQWTSIDGASVDERNGSATPALNDYFTSAAANVTTADTTTLTKTRLTDTWGAADSDLRIGDVVQYELRLHLDEGTRAAASITDTLPRGLRFERTLNINGDTTAPYTAPTQFIHAAIAAPTVTGDPRTGPTTVVWTIGDLVNKGDNNNGNDDFVIVYLARVVDQSLAHVNDTSLTNTATIGYTTAAGAATRSGTQVVRVRQPTLVVSKSGIAAGGDAIIDAGEAITYTVDLTNTGTAPAYDPLLQDLLPVGMRHGPVTMVSTTLVGAGTVLANVTPSYSAATGTLAWNFDTGVANAYTIPAGETLRVIYRVTADGDLGPGMTLTNAATVQRYYSFDNNAVPAVEGVREIYGPGNTATVTFTTAAPQPLAKQNPAVTTASIGVPFTYRITVPATPQTTALHDVRIIDDLSTSAADLSFVSVRKVSGSRTWTPVNTGTAKQLVIEDTGAGIEIPAGEQVVVDLTVVLDDTVRNRSGVLFQNTAWYTFDQVDGNNATRATGGAGSTGNMTIVEPDHLTLQKSGPATMRVGAPGTFTLNLQNIGTGRAWDVTLTDRLPNPVPGGMCNRPPDTVTARIYQADGTTPVSAALVSGTDFVWAFSGEPACTLTVTMRSAAASIGPTERLLVTYHAWLDGDNANAAVLTNVAGATQWFSGDTAGNGATGSIRTYSGTLTDGTPGVLDGQDAWNVTSEMAVLTFDKSVFNVTTGQPGTNATPGDTLRYTLRVTNTSAVPVADFTLRDELDALNGAAMFAPGTLVLVSVPSGADTSLTSATGGARGTGLVSVAHLTLDAAGGANESRTIVFDVRLAPAINHNTVVQNRGQILSGEIQTQGSTTTSTLIASAPAFRVQKTARDMTGDPAVLLAGEVLRYTITVKNMGTENATGVVLRDPLPANTGYVAGSTRLNGSAVADPAAGVSPLQAGLVIHAPEDATAGAMRADASVTVTNVATVTFDVRVDASAVNGTVISNQGFVNGSGAASGPFTEKPSDDPATALTDDPTRNVVGNVPLVDAQKVVAIVTDGGTPGVVDTGDVLRYTLTVSNSGGVAATGVMLADELPRGLGGACPATLVGPPCAVVTYVAGSTRLNGIAVTDAPAGLPLAGAGLPISSADHTPPLPAAGGTLSPGGTATITFDVQVTGSGGTTIWNQGSVRSNEAGSEPTDADGVDANGDQPTEIVIGSAEQVSIAKSVTVVGGGPALANSLLEYTVRVTNTGAVPATQVVISDDARTITGVTYVTGSATMNGARTNVSDTGGNIVADFGAGGDLAPHAAVVVRFRVAINAAARPGDRIANTATVAWSASHVTASDTVYLDVGGTPGSVTLNGSVWHDANLSAGVDAGERMLGNWAVDLYRGAALVGSATTDASGLYRLTGLPPDVYELRFRAPGAGAHAGALGNGDVARSIVNGSATVGPQRIGNINAVSGGNLLNLDLPLQPNGVIYNSVLRTPVAGATVRLVRSYVVGATPSPLPESCFNDPLQQGQITTGTGYYKFDLNFSDPANCPPGNYVIDVTPPTGYFPGVSRIIPAGTSNTTPSFSVTACPGGVDDALPAVPGCEILGSATAPGLGVPAGSTGTRYYLHLALGNGAMPYQSQAFNNHIPADPRLDGAVAITKTAAKVNASRGEIVPYTITFRNNLPATLNGLLLVDSFPAGFKYVEGSARLDGSKVEPTREGLQLRWNSPALATNVQHQLNVLFIVGAGVSEGEYVNRVQLFNPVTGGAASPEAQATVRVVPDPTFDCTDIIGKVFDDVNRNGVQDEGEPGLAGVRIVSARGLIMTTDRHGRYHITCAAVPNQDRGSNFILKLDERSLPTGYRVTTENPLVQRATRGKMVKFNFGAALHRVVSLGLQDGVFEPGTNTLRAQWQPRLATTITELRKGASVLRLSYMADVEEPSLVDQRIAAVKDAVTALWREQECCRELPIESEIFWRRGAAPDKGGAP